MKRFMINQDADRVVYIKEHVEQVEHSTALQLIDFLLCVLGNPVIFFDSIVLEYNPTAAMINAARDQIH